MSQGWGSRVEGTWAGETWAWFQPHVSALGSRLPADMRGMWNHSPVPTRLRCTREARAWDTGHGIHLGLSGDHATPLSLVSWL